MNNYEDQDPNNRQRRSSFAEEFYKNAGQYDYDYEEHLMNASPPSQPDQPLMGVQQPLESSLAPGPYGGNQPQFQAQPVAYNNPINTAAVNSNQTARNNRNYDKLRGGNIMTNNNNQNNLSNNNISRENQQNLSNLANYNYNHNVSDSSLSNQFGGGNNAGANNAYNNYNYNFGQAQYQNQNNFNPNMNDPAQNNQDPQNAMNLRQVHQEQNLNRLKQEMVNDGCCSLLIVLIVLLFGMQGNECTVAPFKMWITVECSYYAFNILFVYVYYKRLLKRRRDDIRFQIANCILNLIHSGWLIYGNILYFQNNALCQREDGTSSSLMWVMLALVIFGYVTLIKCCTYTSLFVCFGPLIYRQYRRARRPDANWQGASRDILKNVIKTKFNPDQNEGNSECIICMCEYEPNDEIIELPCDRRHFFHAQCIENWLKKNNSCPMCKKPITMEDIKNQKKMKKSQRNRN